MFIKTIIIVFFCRILLRYFYSSYLCDKNSSSSSSTPSESFPLLQLPIGGESSAVPKTFRKNFPFPTIIDATFRVYSESSFSPSDNIQYTPSDFVEVIKSIRKSSQKELQQKEKQQSSRVRQRPSQSQIKPTSPLQTSLSKPNFEDESSQIKAQFKMQMTRKKKINPLELKKDAVINEGIYIYFTVYNPLLLPVEMINIKPICMLKNDTSNFGGSGGDLFLYDGNADDDDDENKGNFSSFLNDNDGNDAKSFFDNMGISTTPTVSKSTSIITFEKNVSALISPLQSKEIKIKVFFFFFFFFS
jgi:hypothetical protein